ncbi:MAG: bifunctional diaminohydroxyphosphoribosylaminopyrimidine deaminase/5-amino-6-(5-phosphoribosylamino)uracil reductase RibD [Nanoarchaeota archaeon]|nr:bifunctional diaminohydroxyphosphoribosylaminopyrimidine deaminase/5-amino-6-(5-phosphoribosylamino)uracil reductase RibD [Nanoarchaeota archaeon]
MDGRFMRRCFFLAHKGAGHAAPNPLVGAVVVKNGKILAEGYHARFGGPHAEVVALKKAGKRARGATLYVSLEPCCFTGKTGPCTKAIIKSGITKIVVATRDPNPRVNGKGIKQLRQAGIMVQENVLKHDAEGLNEDFFSFMKTKKPFVVLKLAFTGDGKTTTPPGASKWITSKESQRFVHRLRSRYQSILVGAETVRKDNPSLTVRHMKGKNPIRIVLGDKVSPRSALFRGGRTILATTRQKRIRGAEVWKLPGTKGYVNIRSLLRRLGQENITSVLVEGGSKVAKSFLDAYAVDKVIFFIAPNNRGTIPMRIPEIRKITPSVRLADVRVTRLGNDIVYQGYVKR